VHGPVVGDLVKAPVLHADAADRQQVVDDLHVAALASDEQGGGAVSRPVTN
jgi:hypothetical protein